MCSIMTYHLPSKIMAPISCAHCAKYTRHSIFLHSVRLSYEVTSDPHSIIIATFQQFDPFLCKFEDPDKGNSVFAHCSSPIEKKNLYKVRTDEIRRSPGVVVEKAIIYGSIPRRDVDAIWYQNCC